jgi:hypothetical protein
MVPSDADDLRSALALVGEPDHEPAARNALGIDIARAGNRDRVRGYYLSFCGRRAIRSAHCLILDVAGSHPAV